MGEYDMKSKFKVIDKKNEVGITLATFRE